jgi:hypothetical protein
MPSRDPIRDPVARACTPPWHVDPSGASHDTPIPGYSELLGLVNETMDASVLDNHSRDRLAAAGLSLDTDTAYNPGDTLLLGHALARS